jgi:predicted DNA-binding transcriptional regulator YafY
MRDDSGLRRQWSLLRILSARHSGVTLREMASELGVTDRTIRRDLDMFRGVGFPLEETVGEFGRMTWRLKTGREQPGLGFAFDEAVALLLGRRMLDPLAGTPFGDAARRAFQKIRSSLGMKALEYVDRFAGLFHQTGVAFRDFASKADLIDALQVAMEDGKQARICYRSERSVDATYALVGSSIIGGHSIWWLMTRRTARSSTSRSTGSRRLR